MASTLGRRGATPDADWLLDRIIFPAEPDGCWGWRLVLNDKGYARSSFANKQTYIHRLIYEVLVEAVSDDLHMDHLCRNHGCVNPDHVEPVTCRENIRRGDVGESNRRRAREMTTCRSGEHPWIESNIYRNKHNGRNTCRECTRRNWRNWKERRNAKFTSPVGHPAS